MSFLLDTNTVSEWMKPRPEPRVTEWFTNVDEDQVFLSVVTLAELRFGIEKLASGARKRKLDAWLADDLAPRFEGRIISVDAAIADVWGEIFARRQRMGRPIGAMDALIAATARVQKLKIVTRDASDFDGVVDEIVNPWTGETP